MKRMCARTQAWWLPLVQLPPHTFSGVRRESSQLYISFHWIHNISGWFLHFVFALSAEGNDVCPHCTSNEAAS